MMIGMVLLTILSFLLIIALPTWAYSACRFRVKIDCEIIAVGGAK
jgi:hypothetical protein